MPGPVVPVQRRPRVRISDTIKSKTPERTPPVQQRPKYTCCETPDVADDDGRSVCFNCGTVHEESNIVSEITYGETSSGRAMVHGGTVGNDQRHANSMGGQTSGINGGEGQTTADRGKSAINWICVKIHENTESPIAVSAQKWYKIALLHSFVQGRGILKVAAATIYLASRKRPGSAVLLMDLAEAIQVNVWSLGTVYRSLCQVLMTDASSGHEGLEVLDIEPLMLKFCQRLEFDQDAYRVAADACVILRRMDRDWIVQGRNPAGICGACIIQAARMNNFRRTVREVVYVCRVADTTINQRLYEFRKTQSAQLTVKQFREYAPKLKTKIEPPSVYRRAEREMKAALKRTAEALDDAASEVASEVADEEDDAVGGAEEGTPQPVPIKPTKRQEDMRRKKQKSNTGEPIFAPTPADSQEKPGDTTAGDSQTQLGGEPTSSATAPPTDEPPSSMVVDVDALAGDDVEAGLDALATAATTADASADSEALIVPKRRGRPPKTRTPIIIPDEDIEVEKELEAEVLARIEEWNSVFKKIKENGDHPELLRTFEKARQLVNLHQPASADINTEEEIGEHEFEDDPDVAFCQLSAEESLTKERIWLVENEDWLRQQQQKMLDKAIEDARGNPKKPKQKRRKHQIGDGSVLEGRPATSAADAAKRMLQKRAKHFSSHINYDVFKDIMPGAGSGSATPDAEVVEVVEGDEQGQASAGAAREKGKEREKAYQSVPVGDDEGEEEEEEGYEEGYGEEEEEDLEHRYLSDEEGGFDEDENYDF